MKKKTGLIAALIAVAVFAFVSVDALQGRETQKTFFAMDTVVTVTVNASKPDGIADAIEEEINSLETDLISRHLQSSELSRINGKGGKLSNELAEMLSTLMQVSEKSGGAFDFVLGAVSDLWNFGTEPSVPDAEILADVLAHSGYRKIALNGNLLEFKDSDAVIDLGASGKGAALDVAKTVLEAEKAKRAVVSVGGSILLYGGGDFTVGIRNPEGNAGEFIATLKTKECCVSTSGNYERYFEENGVKYHHIINPETGYPVENGLVSVTVISESGILSDALSTACFVLGVEKGMDLALEFGCEAVFVTADKQIYATDTARAMLEINDKSYTEAAHQ